MPMTRILIGLVTALALGLAFMATQKSLPTAPYPTITQGTARIGGHFTLTDTRGHTVSDQNFRGRLMLVYMGYSHCPDLCPMTLQKIGEALILLGADADRVAALFISLDPARDSPEILKTYLAQFSPRIIGLTGTPDSVAALARAYGVYAGKIATKGNPDYLIDHSGVLYLMDANGDYAAHFGTNATARQIADALRAHFIAH